MAMISKSVFLATMAFLALISSSAAQTSHTVGGSMGWTIPQGSAYTTWAGNQSFRVGDTLVFNFQNGQHDVAEVSKADFDACNANSAIVTLRSGPASVTLNATGSHYYICGITGHCSAGQKLQINVSAAASPAPRPSSPAPQPASPAPRPSSPAPQPASPAPTPSSTAPQPATPSSVPAPSPSSTTPPSPSTTPPSSSPSPPSPSPTPPSSSPTPPSSSTPPTSNTDPSAPSAATSLGVAGVSATFSLVVALFFLS